MKTEISHQDIKYPNKINKEYILERVKAEEIFEKYLGIRVVTNKIVRSPLRVDKHPTCTFYYHYNGVLRFRDWSEEKGMDCFDIVMKKYNVDYHKALKIIINDFNILQLDSKYSIPVTERIVDKKDRSNKSTKSVIQVKISKNRFNKEDAKYLKSYYLNSEIAIKFNVFSIDHAWVNTKKIYTRSVENPCLGYYFGKDKNKNQKWKLYFYKNKKRRFINNTNRINGWIQIPDEGRILIITKSLKDVMVLYKFGIPAIAMQNETTLPYRYIIEGLKSRFDTIYTLMDFDRTGIIMANKIKKLYEIQPLFLTNGRFGSFDYEAKDISDFIKKFGISDTLKLISLTDKLINTC